MGNTLRENTALIIKHFLEEYELSVADVSRAMGFTYQHTYNVLNGASPVTDGFLWRFYAAYVDPESRFYLPSASNALRDLRERMQ